MRVPGERRARSRSLRASLRPVVADLTACAPRRAKALVTSTSTRCGAWRSTSSASRPASGRRLARSDREPRRARCVDDHHSPAHLADDRRRSLRRTGRRPWRARRARESTSSIVGRPASLTSSLRRYSDIDIPAAAARARSTAFTSSGTSRIWIAFGIDTLIIQPLCMQCMQDGARRRVRSRHVPEHPPAPQLRAARDRRRDPRRRAPVRPQGERSDASRRRRTRRSSPAPSTRSPTSRSTCSPTSSPPAPPKDRETEAAKAKARAAKRFGPPPPPDAARPQARARPRARRLLSRR